VLEVTRYGLAARGIGLEAWWIDLVAGLAFL